MHTHLRHYCLVSLIISFEFVRFSKLKDNERSLLTSDIVSILCIEQFSFCAKELAWLLVTDNCQEPSSESPRQRGLEGSCEVIPVTADSSVI